MCPSYDHRMDCIARRRSFVHFPTLRLTAALIRHAVSPLVAFAPASARTRTFGVPAGDAATPLLTFAAQAAEQVAFPPDAVRGVKTNPVKGDFTPRVALQRMTE